MLIMILQYKCALAEVGVFYVNSQILVYIFFGNCK